MKSSVLIAVLLILSTVQGFSPSFFIQQSRTDRSILSRFLKNESSLRMIFGNGSSKIDIPSSSAARDTQAILAVKAALNPSSKASSLIECEFPVLEQLNKLGDGSLRSAKDAEKANLAFTTKLVKGIKPLPFIGPPVRLVTSSAASKSFSVSASKVASSLGVKYFSLREGTPSDVTPDEVIIFLNPSSSSDYSAAQKLSNTATSIILNGFAKTDKSVPDVATMAYFLKPLTYNSQIAGYLIRAWPGKWTTIDSQSKQIVLELDDKDILVRGTNTPDLRNSVKAIQKSFDDRAIRARKMTS